MSTVYVSISEYGEFDDDTTREYVESVSFEYRWECESAYEEFLNEIYGVVTICGMEFDSGHALKELDPIAFRCGVADEYVEVDLDDYVSEDDKEMND